jgi:hypothetical protein
LGFSFRLIAAVVWFPAQRGLNKSLENAWEGFHLSLLEKAQPAAGTRQRAKKNFRFDSHEMAGSGRV